MLDNICIISNKNSERFRDLQNELDYLARFVISRDNILYVYDYDKETITNVDYEQYCTLPNGRINATGWSGSKSKIDKCQLSLCLNHLNCLKLIQSYDQNNWSIICEDDILIPKKELFELNFRSVIDNAPNDAKIIWISSGKKSLNCSFNDVRGFDNPHIPILVNKNFIHIQSSRYTDCILIKNGAAKFLAQKFIEHKFGLPIDWEYNYLLSLYPNIKSYWLTPAIIRQNPKYFI